MKKELERLNKKIASAFDAGAGGAELTRLMCEGVDELLIDLWQKKAIHAAACIDLILVGGNGRGELAPKSDWDIWFLTDGNCPKVAEEEIQAFLLTLWDAGVKVGHAVRGVKECLDHVKEDWVSATAASEARFLAGDGVLFKELQQGLTLFFNQQKKEFVTAKLAEVKERHTRTGGTAFWMKPDIKEGKGGLRDVQALFWMAKVWYGCENIAELVEQGAISVVEHDHLLSAQEFLWRCRTGLHLIMQRPSDRLGFEQQAVLAERMGYQAVSYRPAVDAFMKEYFRHVGRIARVSSLLYMHFQEQLNPKHFLFERPVGDSFTLKGERLSIAHESVFRDEPLNMLRIFREAQKGKRHLSSTALRQIREDVLLIDDTVRDDLVAQRLFLKILRSKRNVHWALRQMHSTGVLGRFIPEFRDVVGLGQFNQYHAFTVDEHTIRAVGEARNFFHQNHHVRLPLAHEVCHKISRPELLYIALLFHDIAKGLPGDHSEVGAKMARNFCMRMQLDLDAVELVEWLVREHLLMAVKSQRFDLSDSEVIRTFSERVGNQSRLDHLLLLTVADIAAVGPNVWNDWKGSLLSELYRLTKEHFLSDESMSETADRLYQTRIRSVLDSVQDSDEMLMMQAVENMSQQCVMHFPPRQLIDIVPLIASSEGDAVKYWVDNDRSETLFYVVARPRAGLFAALAASLTSGHASILAAQAYMLNDGRVLDVFHLQGSDGAPFDVQDDLSRLEEKVHEVLAAEHLAELMFDTEFKVSLLMRNVPVRVRELPKATFHETAIEVSAADRPRLLAQLADTIAREGYVLHGASVSTFGERAVDVFFITTSDSAPLSTQQIGSLCSKLSAVASLPESC